MKLEKKIDKCHVLSKNDSRHGGFVATKLMRNRKIERREYERKRESSWNVCKVLYLALHQWSTFKMHHFILIIRNAQIFDE